MRLDVFKHDFEFTPKSTCHIEGWGAAVAVGVTAAGDVASSEMQSSASSAASSAQEASALGQQALYANEYGTAQGMEAPYTSAGSWAVNQLKSGFAPGGQFTQTFNPGSFQQSPAYAGYMFQQQQGQNAINASAAAKGLSTNPATALAESQFNQGLASTDYMNWYNTAFNQNMAQQGQTISGLEGLTGAGQTATGQLASVLGASTSGQAQGIGNYGNAVATNDMNQGQINSNLTGQLSSLAATGAYGAGGGMNVTNPMAQYYMSQMMSNGQGTPSGVNPMLMSALTSYMNNGQGGNINTMGNEEFAPTNPSNDAAFVGG